eukprot:TRINITY_DN5482_c0_g1_i1.p1 TRINITY_DN5482_c0_g1~~TRINITY_DN5482_c0_g1_i1.p1  ORF type:complete len:1835 (+),score=369.73 TRINITY_DN5482_c0_g1_i1:132-5507(+)
MAEIDTHIEGIGRLNLFRSSSQASYSPIQKVHDDAEVARKDRDEWSAIYQGSRINTSNRILLDSKKVKSVLMGDFSVTATKPKIVRIFTSSTFTDTEYERNMLMKDVYPFLRGLCQKFGYEFQVVDMRWGIRDQSTLDHLTSDLCIREIISCQDTSMGVNFVTFLGDKYGYRIFPNQIDSKDFRLMLEHLKTINEDTSVLLRWFLEDKNALNKTVFVLQPITALLPNYNSLEDSVRNFARAEWWSNYERMQYLLRLGAKVVLQKDPEKKSLFFISVTEHEVTKGILQSNQKASTFCFRRRLTGINVNDEKAARYVDMKSPGQRDNDAKEMIELLREKKISEAYASEALESHVLSYDVEWSRTNGGGIDLKNESHLDYTKKFCDDFCRVMTDSIIKGINESLTEEDPVYEEAVRHCSFCRSKFTSFIGRENILGELVLKIMVDLERPSQPLMLYGDAGCGKTAILARVATKVKTARPQAAVIVRFLGTTPESSTGRGLLKCLCRTISRIYGSKNNSRKSMRLAFVSSSQAIEEEVPEDFQALVREFKIRLLRANKDCPLVLILDSLDQLSNEDNEKALSWIPDELPEYVCLVVSAVVIKGGCYDVLQRRFAATELNSKSPASLSLKMGEFGTLSIKVVEARLLKVTGKVNPLLYCLIQLTDADGKKVKQKTKAKKSLEPKWQETFEFEVNFRTSVIEVKIRNTHLGRKRRMGVVRFKLTKMLERPLGVDQWYSIDKELESDEASGELRLQVCLKTLHHQRDPSVTSARDSRGTISMVQPDGKTIATSRSIFVPGISTLECGKMLDACLTAMGRTINPSQRTLIEGTLAQTNKNPLYLRLIVDEAKSWKSYTIPPKLPLTVKDMISEFLFERLEKYYGTIFVHRALGYLTVAKHGLSQLELEDVLSCDDDLLDDIFQYWVPPIRRFPTSILCRLWRDIGGYLVERGSEGVNVYTWYHQQFFTVASERFTSNEDTRQQLHQSLVEYFVGRWQRGKPYKTKSIDGNTTGVVLENRNVSPQNLVLRMSEDGAIEYNHRRLTELPRHVNRAGKVFQVEEILCEFDFIQAKVDTGGVYDLVQELIDASQRFPESEKIKLFLRFMRSQNHILMLYPHLLFQQAANQPTKSPVAKAGWDAIVARSKKDNHDMIKSRAQGLKAAVVRISNSRPSANQNWIVWKNKPEVEDLCEMTLSHTDKVTWCSFSPRGKKIVSASQDNSIKLWNATTGAELANLTIHENWVTCCVFSPDEHHFVSGSADKTLIVWDAKTYTPLHFLREHTKDITSCCYSPTKEHIASASLDSTIKIWNTTTYRCVATLPCDSIVLALTYSPRDAKYLLSTSRNGAVILWNPRTGEHVLNLDKHHQAAATCCAFSPKGDLFASGSEDEKLIIWNLNGNPVHVLTGEHKGKVLGCVFLDNNLIVSASSDRTLKVWDLTTKKVKVTLWGHSSSVVCCATSSKRLVSASMDWTLKIWDIPDKQDTFNNNSHFSAVLACKFSPNGRLLASGSEDKMVKIWAFAHSSWFLIQTLENPLWITACGFSPDGHKLVVGDINSNIRIWSSQEGEDSSPHRWTLQFEINRNSIYQTLACSFSNDGANIIVSSEDDPMAEYNLTTNKWKEDTNTKCFVSTAAHSWEGDMVVAALDTGAVVFNCQSHSVSSTLHHPLKERERITAVAFSPDREEVVTGSSFGTIRVWNGKGSTGELVTSFEAHTRAITALAYSPNRLHIVSTSEDRSVKVWDAISFRELGIFLSSHPFLCCSVHLGGLISCGTRNGQVFFLVLRSSQFQYVKSPLKSYSIH